MKMGRIMAGVLAATMVFAMTACSKAPGGTQEPTGTDPQLVSEADFRWKDVEGGVELTAYTGDAVHVQIPDKVEDKKVLSLGSAFVDNDAVKTVALPAYTDQLDGAWFQGCDALRRIEGDSVLKIVGGTLDIDSLEELVLPAIASFCSEMVAQCQSLKYLAIPKAFSLYGYSGDGELCPWPQSLEQVVISSSMYARVRAPEGWEAEDDGYLTVWSLVYEPLALAEDGEFPLEDLVQIPATDGDEFYCGFFRTDEIIVNGMRYRWDG